MKILNPFTNWLNKTGTEKEKKTETLHSDYNPRYDTTREYLKDFYKKENKWKRELKKRLDSKVPTYSNNWTSVASAITTVNPAQNSILNINGNTNKVEVKTALEVNGRDILKELDEMRDALLLLKRDVDMETKYPRLKELKDQYEQELEKYKTFEALK